MKIPGLLLVLSLILTQTCLGHFTLTSLDEETVPKSISYTGNISQAVRWTDNTGDNIVILTVTDKTQSKNAPDDSYSDAALYAYHYLVSGDGPKQTWKVYDYVKECPADIFLDFVDETFAVTDLNKDGKAEVWVMYKVACQGDVSPIPMKIIMYQDSKKFAVRGTTRVKVSATDYMGGEYSLDGAFKNAPAEFRQQAEKLWKQHATETWGQ
ncbi:M949_RS01915 family surface polysaccharide biosynthesis protein [Persicitalea sp.]|uniref:M949_RS01915 family surface polysaccharide biosynthesis protein n=1 Tax=Persicitalea sp. TaxID=3100273 RepID=UPI003593F0FE